MMSVIVCEKTLTTKGEQTINLLGSAFGSAKQEVIDFAAVTAVEMGRSESMLLNFAARIGSVVTPQLKKMGAEAETTSAKIANDFAALGISSKSK